MAYHYKVLKLRKLFTVDISSVALNALPRIDSILARQCSDHRRWDDTRYKRTLYDRDDKKTASYTVNEERGRYGERPSLERERRYEENRRKSYFEEGRMNPENKKKNLVEEGKRKYSMKPLKPSFENDERYRKEDRGSPSMVAERSEDSQRPRNIEQGNEESQSFPKLKDYLITHQQDAMENQLFYVPEKEAAQKLKECREGPLGRLLRMVELQIEEGYLTGEMPKNFKDSVLLRLLTIKTKSGRDHLLRSVGKAEIKKTRLKKKESDESNPAPVYTERTPFCNRRFLLVIRNKSIKNHRNYRIANGWNWNPKVVFDCGYSHLYTERELWEVAKQLTNAAGCNRDLTVPVSTYLCNFKEDSVLGEFCKRQNTFENNMVEVTQKSYLDLFPRKNIVVLSPDASDKYVYNPNDILVVGAIVDKGTVVKATKMKAKEERLRSATLPISDFVRLRSGAKLPLPNMLKFVSILHETNGDMSLAIQEAVSNRLTY